MEPMLLARDTTLPFLLPSTNRAENTREGLNNLLVQLNELVASYHPSASLLYWQSGQLSRDKKRDSPPPYFQGSLVFEVRF